jgi:hypothetical protein
VGIPLGRVAAVRAAEVPGGVVRWWHCCHETATPPPRPRHATATRRLGCPFEVRPAAVHRRASEATMAADRRNRQRGLLPVAHRDRWRPSAAV